MRVLVIDDEAALRQTMRRMLESAGHEVIEAEDGRVGLAAFRGQPIDVVVTDIMMPHKEGIETIRELRVLAPKVRIVAVSGSANNENVNFLSMARKLGADAALAKPFRKAALVACVEGREVPEALA